MDEQNLWTPPKYHIPTHYASLLLLLLFSEIQDESGKGLIVVKGEIKDNQSKRLFY